MSTTRQLRSGSTGRMVAAIPKGTVFTAGTCNSWYLGSNIPGKRRQMGAYVRGFDAHGDGLADRTADGYRGFERR